MMKPEPGTYIFILKSSVSDKIQIGRWRQICVEPGYYLYVGSAFGPGGVKARVSRHCRKSKSKHWHIDYLREHMKPVSVWYSHDEHRFEHQWAKFLLDMNDMSSIQGFGCSDCKCYSHLFRMAEEPKFEQFKNIAGGSIESWACQY